MAKYSKTLIIVTIVVALLTFLAQLFLPENFVTPAWPMVLLFFLVINFLCYWATVSANDGKPNRFITRFMGLTVARLFLFLIIIAVYAFTRKDDVVPFTILFFIYYLIFSIFEILAVLRLTKQDNK